MHSQRVRTLGIAITTVFCVAGCQNSQPTHQSEIKKLQGEWRLVEWKTRDGSRDVLAELNDDQRQTIKVTVNGDQFQFRINGRLDQQAIRLSPLLNPPAIDCTRKAGPSVGPADVTFLGVYELQGDRLTIANADPGASRPSVVGPAAGESGSIYVYERIKGIN